MTELIDVEAERDGWNRSQGEEEIHAMKETANSNHCHRE